MSATPGQSIRRFCVACVGSPHDVKKCGGDKCLGAQGDKHGKCYLYPYRLGKGRPSLKLIRRFCLECMGGSSRLVAECVARECHLYAYRFGQRPKRDGIPENFAKNDREGGASASRIDDLISGVIRSTQDALKVEGLPRGLTEVNHSFSGITPGRPRHGDPRVLSLGRALGLGIEECFWRPSLERPSDDKDL